MRQLTKTITCRIAGGLVARITETGVEVRWFRGRRRITRCTWEQICSLESEPRSITAAAEVEAGRKEILRRRPKGRAMLPGKQGG